MARVSVDPRLIVNQHAYEDSPAGCGPAAMLNAAQFGNPDLQAAYAALLGDRHADRLRFAIDRFFKNKPSVLYPGMPRWIGHGAQPEDCANAFRDFLAEARPEAAARLTGGYLDRRESETPEAFVARVHQAMSRSLRAGVPPLLSLRSFVAARDPKRDGEVAWKPARHHFVVVRAAPAKLREGALGFPFEVIDSNGAALRGAYLFAEAQLGFTVPRGDESRPGTPWLSGKPFLLVQAPEIPCLQPRGAGWEDRVIVTANYLAGEY